jgi:hypothetical protein
MRSIATLACALAGLAVASTAAGSGNGQLNRVNAELTVQVELNGDSFTPAQSLGLARIQVRATDIDPSAPASEFGQTQDQGTVSCHNISGDNPCGILPSSDASIAWIDFSADPSSPQLAIANGDGGYLMTLHDGGRPGKGQTGEVSPAGIAQTSSWVTFTTDRGRPSYTAWVVSGALNVKGS